MSLTVQTFQPVKLNFIGPQPYLSPIEVGRISPTFSEGRLSPLQRPFSARRTDENELKGALRFQTTNEQQRYTAQKFNIKLGNNLHQSSDRTLSASTKHQLNFVQTRDAAERQAEEKLAEMMRLAGGPEPATPRDSKAPKKAKGVTTHELTRRYQPVSVAIASSRKEVAMAEEAHRRDYAALDISRRTDSRASTAMRTSKQLELGGQADNLRSRRDAIDARRAVAAKGVDVYQRAQVASRDAARASATTLQQKVFELRAKKEEAQRRAWLAQAHPTSPMKPRWNEQLSTDQALKRRTMARTASAVYPPPPTPPSPRRSTPRL